MNLNPTKNTDVIRMKGILAGGYGQIAKIVMMDPDIPLPAKGIYAYFCSFTGGGNNKALTRAKQENSADKHLYELFVDALTDMLDANTGTTNVKGASLTYSKIYDRFVAAVEAGFDEYDDGYISPHNTKKVDTKSTFQYFLLFPGAGRNWIIPYNTGCSRLFYS